MIIQLLPYRFKTIFPLCTVVTRTIPTTPVSWQSSSVCIVEIHCGSRQFAFGRCGSISFVPGAIDCFSINLWPIAILNGYHGSFRRLIIDVTRVRLFFFFFFVNAQQRIDSFFFLELFKFLDILSKFLKSIRFAKIRIQNFSLWNFYKMYEYIYIFFCSIIYYFLFIY